MYAETGITKHVDRQRHLDPGPSIQLAQMVQAFAAWTTFRRLTADKPNLHLTEVRSNAADAAYERREHSNLRSSCPAPIEARALGCRLVFGLALSKTSRAV